MNKSASVTKLAEALAKAQAEMPVIKMNASNPFLKSKFADLGAVIEGSRPTLAKHGLSISQFPTSADDKVGVTNILMHSSGEWLEDTVYLSVSDEKGKSAAQVAGSVITYLRRYAWAAMLGLYADEDTDGHAPVAKKEAPKQEVTIKSETAQAKVADQTGDLRKQHSDLWKQANAKKLLTPETAKVWSISASGDNQSIEGKIALLTAAIADKVVA